MSIRCKLGFHNHVKVEDDFSEFVWVERCTRCGDEQHFWNEQKYIAKMSELRGGIEVMKKVNKDLRKTLGK